MKKTFIALLAFALLSSGSAVYAQQAFKHLSIGAEVGTAGAGIELALPVITDHLVLKAGYNFPSVSYSFSQNLHAEKFNDYIDEVNDHLAEMGAEERIRTTFQPSRVSTKANANFGAAKLMLELYPSAKSSFHFTAGLYYAMSDDLVTFDNYTDEAYWSSYQSLQSEVNALNSTYGIGEMGDLRFNVLGKTIRASEKDDCAYVAGNVRVAKLRPYLGLGFGRSIPRSRFGFQVDLGVWYHGKPEVESPNEIAYDASAQTLQKDLAIIDKAVVYPQLSFRLTYKLF